jgi:membrane associated rhomboid family serine protease
MGGIVAWAVTLLAGAGGVWGLAAFDHPVWAVAVGAWIGCAAVISILLVLPPQRTPSPSHAPASPRQLEEA